MRFITAPAALAAISLLSLMPAAQAKTGKGTGVTLMASLGGSAEVPGPGDSDGSGVFNGRLNVGQGNLCYTLTSSHLSTLSAAHIHSGKAGVAGPVVVPLTPDAPNETCISVSREIAQKIVSATGNYYVNIHTVDHPAGAVRGQLMKH